MARKIATLHYTANEITTEPWIDRLIEQANKWGLAGWEIVGVKVKVNDKGGRTFNYTLEDDEGEPFYEDEDRPDVPEEIVKDFPEDQPVPEKRGAGLVLPPSGLIIPGKGTA
jgi:hypothetical protein